MALASAIETAAAGRGLQSAWFDADGINVIARDANIGHRMAAHRPDGAGRWGAVWGSYTRPPSVLGYLAPTAVAVSDFEWDGGDHNSPVSPANLLVRTVPLAGTPIYRIAGKLFGYNRGKICLYQLQERGQLNPWLLLSIEHAPLVADAAWGVNPWFTRDRKAKLAYLTCVTLIQERGLQLELLTVTRHVRSALRAAKLNMGLSSGEDGNWIAEFVRGRCVSLNNELAAAWSQMQQAGKVSPD